MNQTYKEMCQNSVSNDTKELLLLYKKDKETLGQIRTFLFVLILQNVILNFLIMVFK